MNKKNIILSILIAIIHWAPIAVFIGFNFNEFYKTTAGGITFSSVFVLIALCFVFKDKVKAFISTPSAWKYILICWLMSLIFFILGTKILIISSILLISFVIAIPLDMWRTKINEKNETADKIQQLIEVVKGK